MPLVWAVCREAPRNTRTLALRKPATLFMNASHQIEVTHSGTTITYNENKDKWEFTLRGRDRSADSLAGAKASIDKPVPAEKVKPFQKVDAWFFDYLDDPKKVQVTGVAESRHLEMPEVWITSKEGRKKVKVRNTLYRSDDKNDMIVSQMKDRLRQIGNLKNELSQLRAKLASLEITKEE